jgi:hypothetical protein
MSRPAPSLTVGIGALGLLATAIPGRADAALSVDIAGSYRLARSGMVMTIGDAMDAYAGVSRHSASWQRRTPSIRSRRTDRARSAAWWQ